MSHELKGLILCSLFCGERKNKLAVLQKGVMMGAIFWDFAWLY
jgi:hypothetical protein